ncbi:MAG: hypothetical protein KDD06_19505 [Phaeodactylibacter sp.]|nr:hypothetical protein [Phaeodactylibacter sp.]MCB9266927.1 hypothetical protein [Lewinellaceae bacterium]MCB9285727.1 hypothetical protein [Lewinellaceae bacterium]
MERFALFVILTGFLILSGCQSGQPKQESGQESREEASSGQPAGEKPYPSLPLDTLQMLWNQCDYIDYVFYYKDFSVSQNQQSDIRASIRHISEEVPAISPSCQPVGRIFYQVQGENRLEADLYFSPECSFFVFYEDGKKAYANAIMPAGVQFFNQVLSTGANPPAGQ